MAGLFGLFGGNKNNDVDENKNAFYLSADDAKTVGDIEYMRTSKTIKRTFARKKGVTEELESVKQISSMASTNGAIVPSSEASAAEVFAVQTEVEQAKAQRRAVDSNMGMFRNMARELKK